MHAHAGNGAKMHAHAGSGAKMHAHARNGAKMHANKHKVNSTHTSRDTNRAHGPDDACADVVDGDASRVHSVDMRDDGAGANHLAAVRRSFGYYGSEGRVLCVSNV